MATMRERALNQLRAGPQTSAQIAAGMGVKPNEIQSLMPRVYRAGVLNAEPGTDRAAGGIIWSLKP